MDSQPIGRSDVRGRSVVYAIPTAGTGAFGVAPQAPSVPAFGSQPSAGFNFTGPQSQAAWNTQVSFQYRVLLFHISLYKTLIKLGT